MSPTPEQEARQQIDAALAAAGWIVQDRSGTNLSAGLGVAVLEVKMAPSHGFGDYLLFVHGKAVGVLEAKQAGYPLSNVELRAEESATGLPAGLDPPVEPLPFPYLSRVSRGGSWTASTPIRRPDCPREGGQLGRCRALAELGRMDPGPRRPGSP